MSGLRADIERGTWVNKEEQVSIGPNTVSSRDNKSGTNYSVVCLFTDHLMLGNGESKKDH